MWAPVMPPATYTPKTTASAHPQVMRSQSPEATKMLVPRPDWLSAATAIATTPSPKAIRTMVPKNSTIRSPARPVTKPIGPPPPVLGRVSPASLECCGWVSAMSVTSHDKSERGEASLGPFRPAEGNKKSPRFGAAPKAGLFHVVSRSALFDVCLCPFPLPVKGVHDDRIRACLPGRCGLLGPPNHAVGQEGSREPRELPGWEVGEDQARRDRGPDGGPGVGEQRSFEAGGVQAGDPEKGEAAPIAGPGHQRRTSAEQHADAEALDREGDGRLAGLEALDTVQVECQRAGGTGREPDQVGEVGGVEEDALPRAEPRRQVVAHGHQLTGQQVRRQRHRARSLVVTAKAPAASTERTSSASRMNPPARRGTVRRGRTRSATSGRITPGSSSTMSGWERLTAASPSSRAARVEQRTRWMAVTPSARAEPTTWACELMIASAPQRTSQRTPAVSAERPSTRSRCTAASLRAAWMRWTTGASSRPLPRSTKRTPGRPSSAASRSSSSLTAAPHGNSASRSRSSSLPVTP